MFMNNIAKYGTQMGNFIFIDSQEPDYSEKISTALIESLEIAVEGEA